MASSTVAHRSGAASAVKRGASSFGQLRRQLGREGLVRLGCAGGQPQGPDHASVGQRLGDVVDPLLLLRRGTAVERGPELDDQRTGGVLPHDVVGGVHDGP